MGSTKGHGRSWLKDALSEDLQRELAGLAFPLDRTPSEPEIRVAQAQLAGWLEGLIHGIQAVLWAQHVETRAQLDEMRRRGALNDPGDSDEREPKKPVPSGQYL